MRELAAALEVSPATVAAAYRTLKQRGFVVADRGRGTSVAALPPAASTRDCRAAGGGARPGERQSRPASCSPRSGRVFARLDPAHRLYGARREAAGARCARAAEFAADGIDGDVAITGGALDAVERALQTELRLGDRVVVEDPSWPRIADLVQALGLRGRARRRRPARPRPDGLDAALRRGARAVMTTPRGQNPTGAAVDPARGRRCARCWRAIRDVLVIEDDYVAQRRRRALRPRARYGRPLGRRPLAVESPRPRPARCDRRRRPADDLADRGAAASRAGLGQPPPPAARGGCSSKTRRRRSSLLAPSERMPSAAGHSSPRSPRRGIEAPGDSGLGVWVPLAEEAAAVRDLLAAGLGRQPGRALPLPQRARDPRHDRGPRAGRGRAARRRDRSARPAPALTYAG